VSSTHPACDRAVRVLVAEAAEPPGRLSDVLEGAGHRVVAHAVTADELAHLVRVARPEVVVFDAEISAEAVAALRSSQPDVGVVVVWPEGATAGSVHEQVSPARIRQDLAGAVGRAAPAGVATPLAPSPVTPLAPSPATPLAPSPATPGISSADSAAPIGRGGLELLVAAVLTFLLVVAAVAVRVEGDGVTLAGSAVGIASPPASTQETSAPAAVPRPPSGAATTSVVGDPRISPGAPAGDTGPGGQVAGGPGPTAARSAGSLPVDAGPVAPVPEGPFTGREATSVRMVIAQQRACRQATVQLGVVASGPPLRRLLHRCAASGSAGLLRAIARVLERDGAMPGRGPMFGAHRGGRGGERGHGSTAHNRQDGAGHRAPGHGPSVNAHGLDHRPPGSRPGRGNGSGHGHAGGHGHQHRRSGKR
jgi:hypothetical protein